MGVTYDTAKGGYTTSDGKNFSKVLDAINHEAVTGSKTSTGGGGSSSVAPGAPATPGVVYSYPQSSGGGLNPLAVAGYAWGQGYYPSSSTAGSSGLGGALATALSDYLSKQTPSVTYPTTPTYVSPPAENLSGEPALTWEQALERANAMVNPLAESARATTLQQFQQQREALPYQLVAKGQLSQGQLSGGLQGLTQAQALALEQLDMQKLAQAMSTAQQLQSGSQEQAASALGTAWNQWLAQQQLANQQQQLTGNQAWQSYNAQQSTLAQIIQWLIQQQGLERADEILAAQLGAGYVPNPLEYITQFGLNY